VRRGEIWWAKLPRPFKDRPVLLLSRDAAYGSRDSVTVAPVTRRVRGLRTEVKLGAREGMRVEGVVNLDDMLTLRRRFSMHAVYQSLLAS
jgi:mRNA interferase MazF